MPSPLHSSRTIHSPQPIYVYIYYMYVYLVFLSQDLLKLHTVRRPRRHRRTSRGHDIDFGERVTCMLHAL